MNDNHEPAAAETAAHLADVLTRMATPVSERAVARVQAAVDDLPVVHVSAWWWQRPLGRIGVRTRQLCGEKAIARDVTGPSRRCRECKRGLDGER